MSHIRKLEMLAAAAVFGLVIAAPVPSPAMGPEPPTAQPSTTTTPSGTTTSTTTKKKKVVKKPKQQQSELNSLDGYRTAYALIYSRADYAGGIAALRTLHKDDNADVANLLGYASRKLGRYDDAKYWYDRALAANPNHTLTLSYYGAWHAEQGNLLKARDYLAKVRSICGTECREYTLLKGVIDGTAVY